MSEPEAPSVEARRESDFESELLARARAWIPAWGADNPQDFGRALLRVAARFNSEVSQRLDRVGEKAYRGFFDWLAVRGEAARPARMPVVFKLVDSATDAVLARAPVSMQADAGSASVNFETEGDVQVLPGHLAAIVGADADKDAIYLQIPGMTTLEPLPPLPTQWRLKSFASAGSTTLQLDPQVGLVPDMIVAIAAAQYRLVTVAKDIVTIDPPLPSSGAGLEVGTQVDQVAAFAPFDPATRDRQMHALYLGHADLLNIDSAATIDIVGADALGTLSWSYWGKAATTGDVVTWQPLKPADPQPPGALRLLKGPGSVETKEVVPGKSARWIAAFAARVDGSKPLLSGGPLQIEINADNAAPTCPLPDPSQTPQIAADAFANTTPITLGTVFYPLGKLPRQFDAFYLGCPEAFSKIGASVQLCFQMSDPSADSFSVVHGGAFADKVLASVGNDRALHLSSFDPVQQTITPLYGRDPLQPPSPASGGAQSTSPPVALDQKPKCRLPIWIVPDALFHLPIDFRVAVTAGSHVWVWAEAALDQTQSGWIDFGDTGATAAIDALVYLDDPVDPQLVALHDGVLTFRDIAPNSTWRPPVTPTNAGAAVQLDIIAPVLSVVSGRPATSVTNGLVGIDSNKQLYAINTNPLMPPVGACTPLSGGPPNLTAKVQPMAFLAGGGVGAFAVADTPLAPLTTLVWLPPGAAAVPLPLQNNGTVVGGSLEAAWDGSNFAVVLSVLEGTDSYLFTWTPRAPVPALSSPFYEPVDVPSATVGGAPAVVGQNVVVPGKNSDVLIGTFDLSRRIELTGDVEYGVIVQSTTPSLAFADVVTMGIAGAIQQRAIKGPPTTLASETFYAIDPAAPILPSGPVTRELLAYQLAAATAGKVKPSLTDLALKLNDTTGVAVGSTLLVTVGANPSAEYVIQGIDSSANPWVVTLNNPAPAAGAATYCKPIRTGGRLAPYAFFDATQAAQQCPAALVPQGAFVFGGGQVQDAEVFATAGAFATLAVMDDWWDAAGYPLGINSKFLLDAVVGSWTRQAGDATSNPDLSWEYWNGAWSKLPLTLDGTQNLKSTGAVSFVAPADITSSDWAGKTSFWIRARLIGGDYGTENVTVVTKDLGGGVTQQTIVRSTSGIKPPVVVSLAISYALTVAVTPTYLLAQDSGSIHDESDANRTAGASVEAFVPLSLTLGRLSGSGGTATPSNDTCPPDCACPSVASGSTSSGAVVSPGGASAATSTSTAPAVVPATGRSLFLGFDAAVGGASVNLLFMAASENNHDALAPLTVEALVGDHFVPVVVEDGTRALGESGILTLAFGEPPTMVELFGQTLNWLKITPSPKDATAAAAWNPNLSGIYLNAAWASATETLTRELLGSSVGEPNLTLTLQRPPLLAGSLQLRVNEPLGDEDLEALREGDVAKVITDDPNLPGDWVLWTRVDDPGDWGPTDRVYALDEAVGVITFGDGQAGAIPPVGTDSIVAFQYQRTEPPVPGAIDVPANAITARTQLNLVTPVATVEAVYSADHAAGGAPPEPDARVLKIGGAALRNRGRAVTATDLEDLTLASSPDIAQARAIVSAQGTRLVVVMRGPNPAPSRAQRRELTRLMLTVTPVAFTAAQALTIEAPVIRRLRISLRLSVDTLDHAGAVAADANSNIQAFLDTLTGGRTGDGWPLGASPTVDDVALALLDIADLMSITDISLAEVLPNGTERAWPATLQAYELAQLDSDALRFQFDSVEQFA